MARRIDRRLRRSMSPNQVSRSQRNELSPQSVNRWLNDVGDTWDRQHSVKELVQGRHRRADQTAKHLALAVRQLRQHAADLVDLRRGGLQSRQSSLCGGGISNAIERRTYAADAVGNLPAEIDPTDRQTLDGRGALLNHLFGWPAEKVHEQCGYRDRGNGPQKPVSRSGCSFGRGTPGIVNRSRD